MNVEFALIAIREIHKFMDALSWVRGRVIKVKQEEMKESISNTIEIRT